MKASELMALLIFGGIGYYFFVGKHQTGEGDAWGSGGGLPSAIPSVAQDSTQSSPLRLPSSNNSRHTTPATSWNTWAKRQISDRAASGAIVDIPAAGSKIPSIMRIEAQSLVAKKLNLPDTLYSVAQPGRASIIQSLLRR